MAWTPPVTLDRTNIASAIAALRAPFHPKDIDWRIGSTSSDKSRGMALCYIDARTVRRRLNRVLGEWNWRCSFRVEGNQMICEIALRIEGEWVAKSDGAFAGALNTNGKPDAKEEQRLDMDGKGAFSTALKRAAVCWGVGEYLYDLPSPWVSLDEHRNIAKGDLPKLEAIAGEPYAEWKRREEKRAAESAPPAAVDTPPPNTTQQSDPPSDPLPPPTGPELQELVATTIARMDEAKNADAFLAAVEDLKRLTLPDGDLRTQASDAFARNAKRLRIRPPKKASAGQTAPRAN